LMRFSWRYSGFARRFQVRDVYVPHHSGSVAVVFFLSLAAVFGMVAGGHASQALKLAASVSGFAVEKLNISGNRQVSDIDVLDALGLDGETSMIGFDVDRARGAIAAFPWVESVSVRKIYPDQVNIAIAERQPVAVWQHDGTVDVIDRQGHVIMPYSPALGQGLPLLVGQGAGHQAGSFLDGMKPFAAVMEHARAYIRIGDRRWDILLDNGVRIRLPEVDAPRRLAEALALENSDGLFSRDIESIDLRLNDRVTVGLSDEALSRRMAVIRDMERREKARKAGRV
jgi:cell division protein FtsQ